MTFKPANPKTPEVPQSNDLTQTISSMRSPGEIDDKGWVTVGALDPDDNVSDDVDFFPPFEGSWANTGDGAPLGFFQDDEGIVHFRGQIEGGDVGDTIFRLPIGYRPAKDQAYICPNLAGGYAVITVQADGYVVLTAQGVGAVDIVDGSITTAKLADGAVTTPKIADNAITHSKMADDSVGSDEIIDGSITAADIADGVLNAHMVASWAGEIPSATGPGVVWRVPYLDGVSVTFDLTRAYVRIETLGASTTTVDLEESPAGAFTPTTITTLTLTSSDYEDEDTTSLGSVDSGQLLRINWTALGATVGTPFTVELEGVEA